MPVFFRYPVHVVVSTVGPDPRVRKTFVLDDTSRENLPLRREKAEGKQTLKVFLRTIRRVCHGLQAQTTPSAKVASNPEFARGLSPPLPGLQHHMIAKGKNDSTDHLKELMCILLFVQNRQSIPASNLLPINLFAITLNTPICV